MVRPDDERPGSGSHWVKSSLSFSNGNCVEVANLSEGGVAVRNSRDPEGPVLRFTPDEWHAFLGGAQLGEFDSFGRLRFKSREQRRVRPDGPGGPSAAASPPMPRRRLDRSRAGGRALRTVPARGIAAAAAPRLARARAVSTVNRRGRYGSPSPRLHPGGSWPAARCGIRANRTRPAGARQIPCSARRPPASIGIWPSARARCVPAPEGIAAQRRRLRVPCGAGTGVPSRGVRAGAGHRLAGEETAPLQVNRKTRRNPVHAVPSVGR
jgi:hypothetical protein